MWSKMGVSGEWTLHVGESQVVSGTKKCVTEELQVHEIDGKGKKMQGARAHSNKIKATFRNWKGVRRCLQLSLIYSK